MTRFAFDKRRLRGAFKAGMLRDRAGTSAVEFAFLTPLFLMFVLGVFELSMAYYKGATVQWSLERAIRQAMIDETTTQGDIEAAMADDLERVGVTDLTVDYSVDDSGAVPLAQISALYQVPVSIPFVPEFTLNFRIEDVAPVPES